MDRCEFCMAEMPESAGAYVPPEPMRVAVEGGYDPRVSPTWARMKQVLMHQMKPEKPLSEQEISVRWRETLISGGKPWRLCDHCFTPLRQYLPKAPSGPMVAPADEKGALDWVVPLHTSIWAVMAGYLGLFSIILIFAPFALAAGIIALIDIGRHPEKTGKGRAIFGIVMGGLFIIPLIFMIISIIVG